MRRLVAILAAILLAGAACGGDDGGGDGGTAAGDGSVSGWCDQVDRIRQLEEEFQQPDVGQAQSPEEIIQAFQESFGEIREIMEDVRGAAPAEIEDDVNTVADAVGQFVTALEDAEGLEDLQALGSEFEETSAQVDEASQRIEEFTERECDVDLSGDGTGGTGNTGGTGDTGDTGDTGGGTEE